MVSLQQVSLGSWLHWPQAGHSVQDPFPCYPSASAFVFSKVVSSNVAISSKHA